MFQKGLMLLTDTVDPGTVEETTKWFEDVNEWFDKPEVTAVLAIAGIVALCLTIYHFGIKKLLKKTRK